MIARRFQPRRLQLRVGCERPLDERVDNQSGDGVPWYPYVELQSLLQDWSNPVNRFDRVAFREPRVARREVLLQVCLVHRPRS